MKIIAIDGVAGAGKGTLAKALSKQLGYLHLDTGALYRCATVCIINNNIDPTNEKQVTSAVKKAKIEAKLVNGEEHYFLNGQDLSLANTLRTPVVNETVSKIAKFVGVRKHIRKVQQSVAKSNKNIVVEGRDITTVVFPNAFAKFYIVADADIRAQRRQKDFQNQGQNIPFEKVKQMIIDRDRDDMERENSPLVCPPDAKVIDNGKNTVQQSVDQMIAYINSK